MILVWKDSIYQDQVKNNNNKKKKEKKKNQVTRYLQYRKYFF